jgi:hypothetical protein
MTMNHPIVRAELCEKVCGSVCCCKPTNKVSITIITEGGILFKIQCKLEKPF